MILLIAQVVGVEVETTVKVKLKMKVKTMDNRKELAVFGD